MDGWTQVRYGWRRKRTNQPPLDQVSGQFDGWKDRAPPFSFGRWPFVPFPNPTLTPFPITPSPPLLSSLLFSSLLCSYGSWQQVGGGLGTNLRRPVPCLCLTTQTLLSLGNLGRDFEYFTTSPNPSNGLRRVKNGGVHQLSARHFGLPHLVNFHLFHPNFTCSDSLFNATSGLGGTENGGVAKVSARSDQVLWIGASGKFLKKYKSHIGDGGSTDASRPGASLDTWIMSLTPSYLELFPKSTNFFQTFCHISASVGPRDLGLLPDGHRKWFEVDWSFRSPVIGKKPRFWLFSSLYMDMDMDTDRGRQIQWPDKEGREDTDKVNRHWWRDEEEVRKRGGRRQGVVTKGEETWERKEYRKIHRKT